MNLTALQLKTRQGRYGESSIGVRLRHYAAWREHTMAETAP
jgi:hypothetical protein